MNYLASVTDFFKSPKWFQNLLLAGLCLLIPIVGPMVVLGWLITGFWCRPGTDPADFPDFEFDNFGKWLERGLWPMLVVLVASIAVYLVFMVPAFIAMTVFGVAMGNTGNGAVAVRILAGVGMAGAELLMIATSMFVIKPLMLAATLTQDFAKAFDWAFLRRFVSLTWLELLLSTLFLSVASIVLTIAGMAAFCVGLFLVPAVIYYSMAHLDKQLYGLYLSRGGAPIPMSPKLTDAVPAASGTTRS